jgi:hypothetical protein
MLKVWVGLEARSFLQASVETVGTSAIYPERMLTSIRLSVASSPTNFHQTYELCQPVSSFESSGVSTQRWNPSES